MVAAIQKHSGRGAAETEESNARERSTMREGWDSQRGSIQHNTMLDAMGWPGQAVFRELICTLLHSARHVAVIITVHCDLPSIP